MLCARTFFQKFLTRYADRLPFSGSARDGEAYGSWDRCAYNIRLVDNTEYYFLGWCDGSDKKCSGIESAIRSSLASQLSALHSILKSKYERHC